MPDSPRMPIRRMTPDDAGGDDLTQLTTAEERLEMVWLLTRRMWELGGGRLPEYDRSSLPVRIVRRG